MKKLLLLIVVLFAMTSASIAQQSTGPQQNPRPPIYVETQINTNHGPSGCNFLVFMNNLPWGATAIQDILTANGETFSVVNSSQMATLDFSPYDVIITASDQIPEFYTDFAASFPKFVAFVNNGGTLEVHAATFGWNSPCMPVNLPGGVFTTCQLDNYNDVVLPAHPIVAGVTSPFYGNYASHGYFSNLVAGTDIITVTSSNLLPTTIQYHYGAGVVTATTVTYEAAYSWGGWQGGIMLQNNLKYSCDHSIAANVPLSDWAIGIGIFLILAAAFVRYKRIF
jgi:hypothetical protein